MTSAPAKIQLGTRRAVDEWIADHPDQDIPRRVKARILLRFDGRCALSGVKIPLGEVDFDHITRRRDGGEHRESNLQPVWRPKHRDKTARENSDSAKADRIWAKHHGIYPPSPTPLRSRNTFQKRAPR